MTTVLKTVGAKVPVGSNPTPSVVCKIASYKVMALNFTSDAPGLIGEELSSLYKATANI